MEEKGWERTKLSNREGGREGGESGKQPNLNTSSQLGKKTMGLLTGDWKS